MKNLREFVNKTIREVLNEGELILKQKEKENVDGYFRHNYDIIEKGEVVGNVLLDINRKEIIIQSINSFKPTIGSRVIKLLRKDYPNRIIKGLATPNSIGFWKKIGVSFDFENPKENDDDDTGDLIPFTLNEQNHENSYIR